MQIACVKTGNKYSDEYVLKLRNGVQRYLSQPHEFVCYTDRPVDGVTCRDLPAELPGWWAKIGLFKLREPLIYFDLDMVITGKLDPLLDWEGFGILSDYWLALYNSSVMVLSGNEGHVFDNLTADDIARCKRGDQEWITEQLLGANLFPKNWFPSLKANRCFAGFPDGALAVNFHGDPKPHVCGGWVKNYWI